MTIPQARNQRWSLDFASDVLSDGRRLRILVVVDDFSRECLALVVDRSLSGRRVARELDRITERRGHPLMIVSDNVLYREAGGWRGQQVSDRQFELAT
jgi:putative transposase